VKVAKRAVGLLTNLYEDSITFWSSSFSNKGLPWQSDANWIKLPNNYNILKFTLRGYFSQNYISVKPKSWRRKSHAFIIVQPPLSTSLPSGFGSSSSSSNSNRNNSATYPSCTQDIDVVDTTTITSSQPLAVNSLPTPGLTWVIGSSLITCCSFLQWLVLIAQRGPATLRKCCEYCQHRVEQQHLQSLVYLSPSTWGSSCSGISNVFLTTNNNSTNTISEYKCTTIVNCTTGTNNPCHQPAWWESRFCHDSEAGGSCIRNYLGTNTDNHNIFFTS